MWESSQHGLTWTGRSWSQGLEVGRSWEPMWEWEEDGNSGVECKPSERYPQPVGKSPEAGREGILHSVWAWATLAAGRDGLERVRTQVGEQEGWPVEGKCRMAAVGTERGDRSACCSGPVDGDGPSAERKAGEGKGSIWRASCVRGSVGLL